jgi:Spy/CpxP family protein refolding chaperone
MKKMTLTLAAIAVGLLFTSQVFAWGPGPGKGRGYGPCGEAGLERLNLTGEQKTKIEALQVSTDKQIRPIREQMFDQSVELRKLWLQANPDKDQILAAQKKMRELRDQAQDKQTELRLEIRKVLTPEQQEILTGTGWGRGSGYGTRGGKRGPGRGHSGWGSPMGMCP